MSNVNSTNASDAKKAFERGTLHKQRYDVIKAYFDYNPPTSEQQAVLRAANDAAKPLIEKLVWISNEKGGAPSNFKELSEEVVALMAECISTWSDLKLIDERVIEIMQDARADMNRFLFRYELWAHRTPEMIGCAINAINLMNQARGRVARVIMERTAEELMRELGKIR